MNKHCYRLIFNRARGLLLAVAETISSRSRAGRPGSQGAGRSPAITVTLKPLTFGLWSLLGLVMIPAAQAAGIVADPHAPGNQQATILQSASGVPLVNIQTPSAAGVSRNVYSQFDISNQGAILNNSSGNVQTQLAGWIQGNTNLAGGTARVILNEVNSSNPSLLNGYVEIAGSRAQLIIANPSGISCDGCGFINATHATLTTGTPILSNGSLQGYRVSGGTISITGNGLDGRQSDYTDILSRAVAVNAGIWANTLNVTTGTNQINVDSSGNPTSTSIISPSTNNASSTPAFALDIAALGGMYAGKIHLIGTEAGLGVRNAGSLGASVGEFTLTNDGQLINTGKIN